MPFEPELLTTEADETPLRQLQPVEPAREEHVEATPAPDPPFRALRRNTGAAGGGGDA